MFYKQPFGRRLFLLVNSIFLALAAIACIFPMIHILAMSFSSNAAVNAGIVSVWPVGFQTYTYEFVAGDVKFYSAFLVSVERTVLGIAVNMLITVITAYPVSKRKDVFQARNFYMWFFVITMLFSGGLIPWYLMIRYTGLIDNIWALIIPSAVPVFNVILLQNFLKELPYEISESAYIDGAGHITLLFRILIPLSKPVIATLVLFVAVSHWNSWFDGMLLMNRTEHYPLQTYLQTIVVQLDLQSVTNVDLLDNICEQNSKAAQIIIAMLPILCVYPFLQKYFTKGIILGSVKG